MGRARIRVPAADAAGNVYQNAAVTLYEKGTLVLNAAGAVTAGTPYQSDLYEVETGGSPKTSFATDPNGMVEIWTEKPRRFDAHIAPSGRTPYKYAKEPWELDTAEVLRASNTSVYPLEMFGFRDGVTSDQAAVQAAVDACAAAGGGIVQAPADATIDLTGVTLASNVWIRGAGPSTVFRLNTTTEDARLFFGTGTDGPTSDLTADAAEGDRTIVIEPSAVTTLGIAAGDLVMIRKTVNYTVIVGGSPEQRSYPYAQLLRVKSVSGGDTVNTYEALADAYVMSASATLQKVTPIVNVGISDCTLDGNQAAISNASGFWVQRADRPFIRNVVITGFSGVAWLCSVGYAPKITDVWIEDCGSGGAAASALSYSTDATVSGLTALRCSGFGPGLSQVVHSRFTNVGIYGAVGRSFKLAQTSYCTFSNIIAQDGSATGISVTTASHHNTFSNCVALNNAHGGLWIGDGTSHDQTFMSHDNVVLGYVGRFDATQDIILDNDSYDNYVHAAVVGVITNTGLRNVVNRATEAYCELTDATDQAIPTSVTTTPLTFATEVSDALGMHASSGASVTIPAGYGGFWDISFTGGWEPGGTGIRTLRIHVNGSLVASTPPMVPDANFTRVTVNSGPIRLAAGDVITVVPFQTSGSDLAMKGTSGTMTLRVARRTG